MTLYRIKRCKAASWGTPIPPGSLMSYDLCALWVNTQVPAYNWQYNIEPVIKS